MNIHTLTDSEKLFGYNEIVLYYELKVKNNPKGFNLTKLKKRLSTLSIIPQIIIAQEKDIDNSIFAQDFQKNPVLFFCFKPVEKSVKYSKPAALIHHLRNSFAHGNVEITQIGVQEYYCFKDISTKSSKKKQQVPKATMIGQIPKSLLISKAKTRKSHNILLLENPTLFTEFIHELQANKEDINQNKE